VCDVPANVERDDTEWAVVRELAEVGFIVYSLEPIQGLGFRVQGLGFRV
jgi:hypothetical protein